MNISSQKILETLSMEQKLAQLVAHGSPSDFVKNGHFDSESATKMYPNGLFGS